MPKTKPCSFSFLSIILVLVILEGKNVNRLWDNICTLVFVMEKNSKESYRERCMVHQINLHICEKKACFEEKLDMNMYLLTFEK